MDTNKKKRFVINALYYTVIFGIIFVCYRFLMGFLLPFVIAFLLVFLLRKPSVLLSQKLKIKVKYINIFLVIASFLLLFLILGGAAFVIIHQIEKNNIIWRLENLINDVSAGANSFVLRLEKFLPESLKNAVSSVGESIPEQIGNFIAETLPELLTKTISRAPKFLFSFAVTIAAGCYFANEYEPLKNFFLSVVPNRKIETLKKIKIVMSENVFKMLRGYGLISLIIFVVCFFVLLMLGNKNSFLWALFITFIDMLPVLGAGTVLVPWAIISALSGNYFYLAALIFLYVCSMSIHHILEPKLVGKSVGVPPLICLLVMFTALKLFGFLGMIISLLSLVTVVNIYRTDDVAN